MEKIVDLQSKMLRDTPLYNPLNRQVAGSNPNMSDILQFMPRNISEIIFWTSNTAPSYGILHHKTDAELAILGLSKCTENNSKNFTDAEIYTNFNVDQKLPLKILKTARSKNYP